MERHNVLFSHPWSPDRRNNNQRQVFKGLQGNLHQVVVVVVVVVVIVVVVVVVVPDIDHNETSTRDQVSMVLRNFIGHRRNRVSGHFPCLFFVLHIFITKKHFNDP